MAALCLYDIDRSTGDAAGGCGRKRASADIGRKQFQRERDCGNTDCRTG